MTGFLGMDVEAIRALSTQLQNASDQITQAANQINSALSNAQWTGTDANSFRSDWQSHMSNLNTISTALSTASQQAAQNAAQQEQASA